MHLLRTAFALPMDSARFSARNWEGGFSFLASEALAEVYGLFVTLNCFLLISYP
jgi:hypothetical protein